MPLITSTLVWLKNGGNKVLWGVLSDTFIMFTGIIKRKSIIFPNKMSDLEMEMDFSWENLLMCAWTLGRHSFKDLTRLVITQHYAVSIKKKIVKVTLLDRAYFIRAKCNLLSNRELLYFVISKESVGQTVGNVATSRPHLA